VGVHVSAGKCYSVVARHTDLEEGIVRMYDVLIRPVVRLSVAASELRRREHGQTTTEYAILLGFLAIAIIIALFFLRNVLRDLFSDAASSVSNAGGP
jgi:Flp pilus assembly pilin Flp